MTPAVTFGIFRVPPPITAHSSRGPGRRPLTAVTRVRIPYALPTFLTISRSRIASVADDDLKRLFDSMRQENAAAHSDTRRHFEDLTEGTRKDIHLVAESVVLTSEKLDRTATNLDQKIARTAAETQRTIKFSSRGDRPPHALHSKTPSPTFNRGSNVSKGPLNVPQAAKACRSVCMLGTVAGLSGRRSNRRSFCAGRASGLLAEAG